MLSTVSCTNKTCGLFHYFFGQKLGDIWSSCMQVKSKYLPNIKQRDSGAICSFNLVQLTVGSLMASFLAFEWRTEQLY